MGKIFTLLITVTALLLGGSGGKVWGQNYIGGDTNVNNDFGAGESATISGTQVTWPGGNHAIAAGTTKILVGSANSQNIVINTYNGNGLLHDYTNYWIGTATRTSNQYTSQSTACNNVPTPYTWNVASGITWGSMSSTTSTYSICDTHSAKSTGTSDPYVTDQWGSTDDGVLLVQRAGSTVSDDGTWGSRGSAPTNGTMTQYQRPTTVAIGGVTTLEDIIIRDIRWYFMTHSASQSVETLTGCSTGITSCSFTGYDPGSVGYDTHWTASQTTSYAQHQHKSHNWGTAIVTGTDFLDGAIQILGGANVCVTGNVADGTMNAGSVGGSSQKGRTDAMFIWPKTGKNFQLRVGGDFNEMPMNHDDNAGNTNLYYSAAGFPQTKATDMYLYPGSTSYTTTFTVVNTAASTGLYATTPSLTSESTQYVDIPLPYSQTRSGVLGVNGTYSINNAIVHTGTAAGSNNPGVIEIGGTTTAALAAAQGINRFYIYSGGTIKNFNSVCTPVACDVIRFSGANAAASGSPKFIFDGTAPLNILNDGNCCTAAIIFADAGAIGEITTNGVNSAIDVGDLLVRAHGQVELGADANFDVNTSGKHNNVSILSDSAYITTKAFEYSAGGGSDKGHVTLWAQGRSSLIGGCGGYINIDGTWTTSSTSTASSWQNLYAAVQKNSQNLANFAGCGYNEEMDARSSGALNTNVQTRIQSENDYVTIANNFAHTGVDGGLFVQGAGNVNLNGATTTINFGTGTGDAVIQSKSAQVIVAGALTYTGNITTDLFIDGETGVQFRSSSNPSSINYTTGSPSAHIGIQSNAGSIAFSGNPFNFNNYSTGNTQIWAGNMITNAAGTPLTFTYQAAANSQNIDMYAGDSIVLKGDLTFAHNDPLSHTGDIALRAYSNKDNLWAGASNIPGLGVCPVRCPSAVSTKGDIELYTPVTIDYDGVGNVWMAANRNINVRHDYSHTAGAMTTNIQTGFTRFVAGYDITTGIGNENSSSFNYTHDGLDGDFDMKAGNDIITHNKVNLTYTSNAKDINTTLKACRNIDIRNAYTYMDEATNMWARWYADQDILTNSTCIPAGAPVNFTSMEDVKTDWNAGRNIHTDDSVKFHYGNTGNTVRDLKLIAQGGNIEIDRYLQIDFDSDNLILFSAEMQGPGQVHNGSNSFSGNRNTDDGNILFNDSFNIYRTNVNSVDGLTEILAKYNIRTAMVTMDDKQSVGNSTLVESHMGDIFLGYSTDKDGCQAPAQATQLSYDLNRFLYTVSKDNTSGSLNIKAGYEDNVDNIQRDNGGNIYFTHIDATMGKTGTHSTEISIPFSNEYYCNSPWSSLRLFQLKDFAANSRMMYEHAGIIGGVGPCGHDDYWSYKYLPSQGQGNSMPGVATDTSLIYHGNKGSLLLDAGTRGNVIMNRGTYLNFQGDNGNSEFRTRWGNIDMRYPFNADSLRGSLLFLASSDLPNKLKVNACGCDEERNNIYLQDFKYIPIANSGSIFVGADNNIKLQYGGLKSIGTERDPFFSPNDNNGYPCGDRYHCDSDTSENQARDLILNFANTTGGGAITSGGFGAVASDLIDVYKNMIYTGGQGSGMSSVPGYGNLHGEAVAGYGLYIKTQANKNNWNKNALDAAMTACYPPKCDDPCTTDILQNVARVTFHSDARVYAENQRVYIGSPVLESFGNLDLNTHNNKGGKTAITIQTDSLIVHDSLIIDGKLTKFTTWSGLYRDMPIIKLGHQRFTPPFVEDGSICKPCFIHQKGTGTNANRTALDTLYVTYRNGAAVPRLHTLIADHTVLSFLTDSFDHVKGDPTINAKFYTDTFKVRNHVELYTDAKHEHDGHFELISEAQMDSKDYAGIYARHLHMEPIAPTCAGNFPYSQLWMQDPALDVITTSTFGGYGWIHADVHVEIEATLAPGFASLRDKGNYCYELKAGTLRMQDLRLDKGAQIRYTIGTEEGLDGELADCIEVDEITMYGSVDVIVEKRCGQQFKEGCYPIIRYNSVAVDTVNLNNLKLATKKIDGYNLSLDTSIPGTVYLCVGSTTVPQLLRSVFIPQTEGVTTDPEYGMHYVVSMDKFSFKAKYTTEQPLMVMTDRLVDGAEEELFGTLNANGEYEYVIRKVQQNIVLKFGPGFASVDNTSIIDGKAVWSYGNTIYIRVEKEDIASIYSIAGQLVKRIELPEGDTSVPMERGVYIVTLKDGSVHKVILK